MNISYDKLKELHASRIRAEQNHLTKFKKVIYARDNTFSKQFNKDFLFNIKAGKQV